MKSPKPATDTIYPHIKFWWYRTMLNFYAVFWQPFWKWQISRKFWKRRIAPLMVTYHYVKFYVSIIIHLKVININVRNFNFPIGFYSNPHPLWSPTNMTLTPFTTKLKILGPTKIIYSTKFHEILSSSSWDLPWTSSCAKERKEKKENNNNNKKIIIIRNGVKTISLQTLFGRLNYVRHQQGLGVFSTYSLLVYISLGSLQYYIYIDSV